MFGSYRAFWLSTSPVLRGVSGSSSLRMDSWSRGQAQETILSLVGVCLSLSSARVYTRSVPEFLFLLEMESEPCAQGKNIFF